MDKEYEKKCKTCNDYGIYSSVEMQETGFYCKLNETPDDINERTRTSPRIEKFFETGCKDFK